jgi:hypothetical protein
MILRQGPSPRAPSPRLAKALSHPSDALPTNVRLAVLSRLALRLHEGQQISGLSNSKPPAIEIDALLRCDDPGLPADVVVVGVGDMPPPSAATLVPLEDCNSILNSELQDPLSILRRPRTRRSRPSSVQQSVLIVLDISQLATQPSVSKIPGSQVISQSHKRFKRFRVSNENPPLSIRSRSYSMKERGRNAWGHSCLLGLLPECVRPSWSW